MKNGQFTDEFLRKLDPQGMNKSFQDSSGLYITAGGEKIILRWHVLFSMKRKVLRVSLLTYPLVGIDEARFGRDIVKAYAKNGIDPREKLIEIYGAINDLRKGKIDSARDFIYQIGL